MPPPHAVAPDAEYHLHLTITSASAADAVGTCVLADAAGKVYAVGTDLRVVLNKTLKFGAPQQHFESDRGADGSCARRWRSCVKGTS